MISARYELFLRASAALSEETLKELEAACRQPVVLDPYRNEAGELRGVDLRIDLDEPGAIRELCALAFELARERALTLFDPQLGRVVAESESAAIEEQAARGGAFAEGAALSSPAAGGSAPASTRLWLIVAIAVVAVILLMRFLR